MLSVIVPIYNAEKYLSRCLDSLLNQDVEDYEIVCVNDGSTDSSSTILADYAKRYPNVIRILEQPNQGLPVARNVGMEASQGEVIAFCDSDDYVISGAYGYILTTFWKEKVDVLKFNSITVDKYVQKEWNESNDVRGTLQYEGSGIQYVIKKTPNFSFVWSYFYRKAFLSQNRIHFRPVKQCEDVAFNLDVYMCNPYVVAITSNIYRYTVSAEQITRIREPRHLRAVVESYIYMFGNMNAYMQKKPELRDALQAYKQREAIPCMSRVLSADYEKEEWICVKEQLHKVGMLPMHLLGWRSKVINGIMASYQVYWLMGMLYRNVFVPYILPRLSRN